MVSECDLVSNFRRAFWRMEILQMTPAPIDMEGSYPGFVPPGWKITPWKHDW